MARMHIFKTPGICTVLDKLVVPSASIAANKVKLGAQIQVS